MARKQKIGLITTGGTIAMALAGDYIENEINFTSSELLNAVPQMRLICDVKAVDLFSKPSSSLLLEDIVL